MTNLTEKLKKRELPDGFYWIEFQDGEITPTTFSNQHGFICCDVICDEEKIKQILAEMPSYEQWQKHRKTLLKTQEKNCDLEIINTKLKELLKEANNWLNAFYAYEQSDFVREQVKPYLTKIKQVLGEE